jgi:hypothetical protein
VKRSRSVISLGLTACLCVGLTAGSYGVAQASPVSTVNRVLASESGDDLRDLTSSSADLEAAFSLIESIPEDVLLAGDKALQNWADANHISPRDARANVVGCAGAIALVIASTAFPAAKILKIKRLINSLGGVAKAVRLFWGASFSYEKLHALGGAAAALGAELLGITQIKKQCFR